MLEDIVPGLHYVWESGGMRKMKSLKKELIDDYIGKKFQEHKNTFDKGRDGYYDVSFSTEWPNPDLLKGGWITCDFLSFSKVFQWYQNYVRV